MITLICAYLFMGVVLYLLVNFDDITEGIKNKECSVLSVIAMYEEENTKIEQQIADVVTQYQEYEEGIFTEVAPESAMTLVALYPELKSDTLVQSQIEIYADNNKQIKELKCKAINTSVIRWWLYFGK